MNNIAAIFFDMEEYEQSEEMYWKCIAMLGDVGTDSTWTATKELMSPQ